MSLRLDPGSGWGRVPVDPRVPDHGDAVCPWCLALADCMLAAPGPATLTRFATSVDSWTNPGATAQLSVLATKGRNTLNPTPRLKSLFQTDWLRLRMRSSGLPGTRSSRFASGGFCSTQACVAAAS